MRDITMKMKKLIIEENLWSSYLLCSGFKSSLLKEVEYQ